MKTFENYRLDKGQRYAVLNADYYLCIAEEQGEFVLGTPQCWDDVISARINFEQYDICHVFTHALEKNKVNRITDHKGVWNLAGLPAGVYDTYYDIKDVRVYMGICMGQGVADFQNNSASLEILLPKHLQITHSQIADLLFNSLSQALLIPDLQSLLNLQSLLPDSLVLFYDFQQDPQLMIVGEKAEMLIKNSDCSEWEKCNAVVRYHHPWP